VSPLAAALLMSLAAGATIPIGALLARVERIQPRWLEAELRHSVMAFGGGALLAAVSLVLVPEGTRHLHPLPVVALFLGGGLAFLAVDRWLAGRGGAASQLMAMLLDFVPEALALGAVMAEGRATAILLAFLIGLQNLPEGFNSYRELVDRGHQRTHRALALLAPLPLLGPLAAWIGIAALADRPQVVGGVMLFAAGGILYLIFQDIAPQVRLERRWAPPLGAVLGFLVGLLGEMWVAG
jgi:ZIP family zinc transporter